MMGMLKMYTLFLMLALLPLSGAVAHPEIPFPMGERLEYRLYWGWIHAANSVATTDWVEEEGKRYILILSRTQSRSSYIA